MSESPSPWTVVASLPPLLTSAALCREAVAPILRATRLADADRYDLLVALTEAVHLAVACCSDAREMVIAVRDAREAVDVRVQVPGCGRLLCAPDRGRTFGALPDRVVMIGLRLIHGLTDVTTIANDDRGVAVILTKRVGVLVA